MANKELKRNMEKQKQKLQASTVFREALLLPLKNTNFILFTFIASVPLFFLLVLYETLLQKTMLETLMILAKTPVYLNYRWLTPLHIFKRMTQEVSSKLLQLILLYLLPLHFFELCTTIVTIDLTSNIYTRDNSMDLKERLTKFIDIARFRGNFMTSSYVLFLSTGFLIGSLWLVANYYIVFKDFIHNMFVAALCRVVVVGLVVKYLEWSAVWNMSVVISVLEKKCGADALIFSGCLNSGNERKGFVLMLVFFLWVSGLRLTFFYRGSGIGWGIMAEAALLCLGNVVKWVAVTIYFHNCRDQILGMINQKIGAKTLPI